jgi:carboxylesterase
MALRARTVTRAGLSLLPVNLFLEPEHQPFLLEGGRPSALLVHGFGGTPAEMRAIGETLHQDGWTVQALLLPGFGSDIATLTDRRYAEWIDSITVAAEALRKAGNGPLLLVGYSLGATLSIVVCEALHPPPDGMALLAPFWWKDRLWLRVLAPVLRPLLSSGMRPFRRADLRDPKMRQGIAKFLPGADLEDPNTQQALRDFRVPISLIEEIIGVSRLAYERAGTVVSPVLVVQGRRDEVVRVPLTQKLIGRFSGAVEYVEVDSGHDLTQPSNPAWPTVRAAVLGFARALPGGPVAGFPGADDPPDSKTPKKLGIIPGVQRES